MKKIIWVFLAVALCACSGGSKSNSTAETKSVTVRERMRMDGWDEIGLVWTVRGISNKGSNSHYVFVKNNRYTAILANVVNQDESEVDSSKYRYAVTRGSFRVNGEYYTHCIQDGNDYYLNL